MLQGAADVDGGVFCIIVGLHLGEHLIHDVVRDLLHAVHILHGVGPAGRILLNAVFLGEGLLREFVGVNKELVFCHGVSPPLVP